MSGHTDIMIGGPPMQGLSLVRSLLFSPADKPDRFPKAASVGADGAVLDLEDGVGFPNKEVARRAALESFAAPLPAPDGFIWALRLNHVTTPDGLRDLLALREAANRPEVVMLPKTESVAEVEVAVHHLGTP